MNPNPHSRIGLTSVVLILLVLGGLCAPRLSYASPDLLAPACMVSTSISTTPDSVREAKRHRRHDDRMDSTLSAASQARRNAQAFDAQCWAVAAPIAIVASGVLIGWTASADGRPRDADLGALLTVGGVVVGPAFGWARAGYWDQAASSVGLRAATMVGALVMAGAIAGSTGLSGDEGLGVGLICATAGVTAITVEMVLDVRHLGRHVRAHGFASEAQLSLLTSHGPGLAVTLPLH